MVKIILMMIITLILDGDLLPAFNFDSTANTNDGSCIPMIFGCTDEDYLEFSLNIIRLI